MDLSNLINITTIMQGLQTLLIAVVVFYFYFIYRKNYLSLWAWSWLFCSFYLFGGSIGLLLAFRVPADDPLRLLNAMFYLSSGYLQVPLLILGSYELSSGKQISRKTLVWYFVIPIIFGIAITFVTTYLTNPNLRFVLRISAHALVSGIAFLIGAFCISRIWNRRQSAGRRIVLSSFLVYGTYQCLYAGLPFVYSKLPSELIIFYILFESILLFWIAFGLVAWLLEDERDRAVVASEALQSSEALFRQLTENNAAGIFILQNEKVRYINPTAANILQFERAELLGQSFLKQVHQDFVHHAKKNYEQLINGVAVPRGETKMLARDNSERWLEMTGTAIEFQHEPAVLITGIDITKHKQAQEQLLQAQKLESIGMLAGGVAHDFNNMLTGMIGFTELAMLKITPDHPVWRNLERVKDLCNRASDLTKQLLAFARRQILSPRVININETIQETTDFLRRVIGANIEIEVSLAKNLRFVKADPTQIRQVITNLALNARDAMPEGGKLTIKTRNVETNLQADIHNSAQLFSSRVELIIQDTGIGMNNKTQARIFEPFFTTKEMGRGTGLGLAIIYGVIKQHKGSIKVLSEIGAGSTFVIQLPTVEATVAAPQPVLTTLIPVTANDAMILVVEDEQSVRELIQGVLTTDGYRVLAAADGLEAIEFFERYSDAINLVITDAIMPNLGGEAVFKVLRDKQPDLRFLFISGYGLEIAEQEWSPEVDVLLKPFDSELLRQKVKLLLSNTGSNQRASFVTTERQL